MKKILLATTILGMTAGFAAAEVSFSGSAEMGVARQGDDATTPAVEANTIFQSYTSIELAISMTGETDGGLTFGASTAIAAGDRTYTFGDEDGFDAEGGTMDNPEVYISGSFGKLAMKTDGYGFFFNDDDGEDHGDVKYTGSFGAITVGLVADVESTDDAGDDSNMSVNLAYAANNLAANLNYDDNGDYDVSLGYTFGALTATIATDVDNVSSLKLAYANNGITGSVKIDSDEFWEVAAGYSANGMSVNLSTDKDSAWSLDGGYDLGGGLSVVAGVNYTDDVFLGAKMSF